MIQFPPTMQANYMQEALREKKSVPSL